MPSLAPSTRSAPALETERLILAGHTIDDYADCAAMWADPAVTRHIGGKPFGADEVWAKVLRNIGHWTALGYGYWVARDKATGRFVGEVGLGCFKRQIEPSFEGAPEAGWALATWAHGRGYATEAVRAALAWGDAHLGRTRVVCMIAPDNAASIRVAAKCGFREFARTAYKGEATVLFER
jgi:RimJ/RimL family protein N-acetyltransferase